MMAALNFHMRDMYPNLGHEETNTQVQPDATDQQALVDNQKVGEVHNVNKKSKFNILMAIGVIVATAILMGVVGYE